MMANVQSAQGATSAAERRLLSRYRLVRTCVSILLGAPFLLATCLSFLYAYHIAFWLVPATLLGLGLTILIVLLPKPIRSFQSERIHPDVRRRFLRIPSWCWPVVGLMLLWPLKIALENFDRYVSEQCGEIALANQNTPGSTTIVVSGQFDGAVFFSANELDNLSKTLHLTRIRPIRASMGLRTPWNEYSVAEFDAQNTVTPSGALIPLRNYPVFSLNLQGHSEKSQQCCKLLRNFSDANGMVRTGTHRQPNWLVVLWDTSLLSIVLLSVLIVCASIRMFLTTPAERRTLRIAAGLCPTCRYNGGHIGKCPECGNVAS